MNLSETDRRAIGERAARLEARTGVQAVAAVVGKCDTYPEVPWKAFALFSGLAALAAMPWGPDALMAGTGFLLAGATAALATLFLPAFARLFLDPVRRETETRQYAAALFFDRDLSRTPGRNAILILIGRFERTLVILPDAGLRTHLDAAELQGLIVGMAPSLAAGQIAATLIQGLDALETLLVAKGLVGGTGADEIGPELCEEEGA